MSGNLYPKQIRLPRDAGCSFVRDGKGSHEIWWSPVSQQKVSVPKNTRIRHTANKILRDAGLPPAF